MSTDGELRTEGTGADISVTFRFNGRHLVLTHSAGSDHRDWTVLVDGVTLSDTDDEPKLIEAERSTFRADATTTIDTGVAGVHVVAITPASLRGGDSSARPLTIVQVEVLEPERSANIGMILAVLAGVAILAGVMTPFVAAGVGPIARRLTTKRIVMAALAVYVVIALLGFVMDSVFEFWVLAWLVGTVQGGAQSLDRSLRTHLTPKSRIGEFFGFYSTVGKFAGVIGPLMFFVAATIFDASRPALIGVLALFLIGMALLSRVDVEAGIAAADEADRVG